MMFRDQNVYRQLYPDTSLRRVANFILCHSFGEFDSKSLHVSNFFSAEHQ